MVLRTTGPESLNPKPQHLNPLHQIVDLQLQPLARTRGNSSADVSPSGRVLQRTKPLNS